MQLENMRCKNCGAELDITKAVSGVVKCEYCESKFTLPKEDITPAALKFLHDGESSLYICRFDDAFAFYKKAAELSPKEPEAYWGMAISQFKVQYIKDEVNDRLQPVCHLVSTDNIKDNENYKKAISLATRAQREEYEKQAREIDYIKEEFYKLKQTGKEYDCFICVKVTDDITKGRTSDYKRADDIYFDLKGKGYNPFFSERELVDVTGADYEARILYALYTSECMIVVCGKEEYLHTKWVKNEYTRFLRLVGDEEKESDSITIAFEGRPVEYLPGKNGKIQGIDLRSLNASEKITKFVENHTPEARARRAQAEQAKKEREASILQEIEKQKQAQRELEERLQMMREGSSAGAASATTKSLLTRANQFLAGSEYGSANEYYNKVLDIDPQNAEAWFGLLLAQYQVKDYKQLFDRADSAKIDGILSDKNYNSAKTYATGEFAQTIQQVELYAKTKRVQALHRESDDAWNRFLNYFGFEEDSAMRIALDGKKVAKLSGNSDLAQAYKLADAEQKARYDGFMQRIKQRVEELRGRDVSVFNEANENYKAELSNYESRKRKFANVTRKDTDGLGWKYLISSFVGAVACLIVMWGFGCKACISDEVILGIKIGDGFNFLGYALDMIFISVGAGFAFGLIVLLTVLLPRRSKIRNDNYALDRLDKTGQSIKQQKEELDALQSNINIYDKFLKYCEKSFAGVAEAPQEKEEVISDMAKNGNMCNVSLANVGDRIVTVIKIVREYTGGGLIETKKAVESCGMIAEGISVEEGERLVKELEEVGARAYLEEY